MKEPGPVVRTAPNELSFNTAQAFKDIYDFKAGRNVLVKSDFYEGSLFADQYTSIGSERDPAEHGQMRRFLSHAFSHRSLMEQEPLISSVIDAFMRKLKAKAEEGTVVDIQKWYNILTFDITGELAFGESFRGIETGKRSPKSIDRRAVSTNSTC